MSDPIPSRQQWSITAKLSGLGAFLAALALVLTKIGLISVTLSGWYHRAFPPPVPYDVIASSPTDVPSYLRFYYLDEGLGKQESLYWFRVQMQNKSRLPITLSIEFNLEPLDCEFVQLNKAWKPDDYELKPGETLLKEVSPALEWLDKDAPTDCYLEVHYSIRDDRGDKPHPVSTDKIKILPRHKVKWDLANVDHKPVSRDFLLASLSAWSLSREGSVIELAKRLDKSQWSPEQWVSLCYRDLFQGQLGLRITPTANTYPFEEETTLRAPGQILSEGSAEPLEAALLMAAVINAAIPGQMPLTLFILPEERSVKNPAILLAWNSPVNDAWEAIDLRLARTLGFQENLQQAKDLPSLVFSKNPQIRESVTRRGVFYGAGASLPTVISFDRAVKTFQIRPLP